LYSHPVIHITEVSMANEKQVFDRIRAKLQTAVRSLPKVMGNEAVNFSLDRFKNQSWLDTTADPWKPRTKKDKKNAGRSLLIQTGRLRRSVRVISIGETKVSIGTDVPYARIHNYGGTIQRHARSETFLRNRLTRGANKGRFKKGVKAGKGFSFKAGTITMPRRQFIGRSQALILRLTRMGQIQIGKALK